MRCRFVLSGSGGQGVITAAIILAEAAVYHERLNAVQTQSYGPEARGGAARSDVVVSTEEIRYPKVVRPNVLACLSQEAYDKYSWIVRPGGMIIVDRRFVKRRQTVDARQVELDMHNACVEELGNPLSLNCCLLGAIAGLIDLFEIESITKVVEGRFSEHYRKVNAAAVKLGHQLVRRSGEKVMHFKEV